MDDNRLLTITTEDGKEILCEILFTHKSEKTGKNYVVFVQQGTNDASAAIYEPKGENGDANGELKQIETEEEWAMLEELLEDYSRNMGHDEHGCGGCDGGCGDGGCGDSCGCGDDEDEEDDCSCCGCGR